MSSCSLIFFQPCHQILWPRYLEAGNEMITVLLLVTPRQLLLRFEDGPNPVLCFTPQAAIPLNPQPQFWRSRLVLCERVPQAPMGPRPSFNRRWIVYPTRLSDYASHSTPRNRVTVPSSSPIWRPPRIPYSLTSSFIDVKDRS